MAKQKKGYVISIVNNKGGVGKTTVTCNLAHALGRKRKRVLVVDADPQSNTTSILLNSTASPTRTLNELLDSTVTVDVADCIYPTPYNNVLCLPNVPETAGLEPDLIRNAPGAFFRLRESLREYAVSNFDFTLIDNPPNMGTFVIGSLHTSDFVIVPNEIDSAFSLQGLVKAINLIDEIRQTSNPNLKFLRLLINKVDNRTSMSKVAIDIIHSKFKPEQYFNTIIPINAAFRYAEHRHQTILKYKSGTTGAAAYRELADELVSILS